MPRSKSKFRIGIPALTVIVLLSLGAGMLVPFPSLRDAVMATSDFEIIVGEGGDKDDAFLAEWRRFCEELMLAGVMVSRLSPGLDETDRAEGYRFLTRMLRLGLLVELEYVDPDYPQIWESETPTMKSAGNNPDELYHELIFDGSETYRIRGKRGTTPLIEMTVYEGRLGSSDTSRYVGHLMEDDLIVDDRGNFEVVLSPDPHSGNWIRTTPESNVVLIRQYRFDWDSDIPAVMDVVREEQSGPPQPLELEPLGQRLEKVSEFVKRSLKFWTGISRLSALRSKNAFAEPIIGEDSDAPDSTLPRGHVIQPGSFELGDDEVLLISFVPPEGVAYWGFAVYNWWYENLDYRYSRVHLNNFHAITDPDGTVIIALSNTDPGLENWVDTAGHGRGSMLLRWTRPAPGTRFPEVTTEVVKREDL